MQFKHPELLYALFLLLIPIIVHLFQLRKFKKEAFTNVAFLKQVSIQTRKSSQLKKWLTLALRLLALGALIFAFAQPYLSSNDSFETTQDTVIWLDNSFSMQKKGANGELLKRAVQELIENTDEAQVFTLFTNDIVYKNTTLKAIQNDLLKLNYSPKSLNYNAAVLKGSNLFDTKTSANKNLILISDFQEQKTAFQPQKDSSFALNLVQLKPVNNNNILLDSLYLSEASVMDTDLSVVVKSFGFDPENVPVSLYNDDKLIAKTSVSPNNGLATAVFSLPENEVINGKVTIEDPNLTFDNTLFFNINEKTKINVLAISDASDAFLRKIFTENEFNYNNYPSNALDFNTIDKQNIILLNEVKTISNALSTALSEFKKNGGSVIVIPSPQAVLPSYNQFLAEESWQLGALSKTEKQITTINYSHPIYQEVFDGKVANFQYPKVQSFYPLNNALGASMLTFEDGKPFLLQQDKTYLFTAALNDENSNFTHSDLIITLYAIAKNSLKTPKLYSTIGIQDSFDVEVTLKQDEVITLNNGQQSSIPQQQYFNNKVTVITGETPEVAGIYSVSTQTENLQKVSFNYSRNESNMSYQSFTNENGITLSNSVNTMLNSLKNDSKINELWKWFVIFALIFLLMEMLILKYLK